MSLGASVPQETRGSPDPAPRYHVPLTNLCTRSWNSASVWNGFCLSFLRKESLGTAAGG